MYIPPGFTLITCKPVNEDILHSWAVQNGGVWHLAGESHGGHWPAGAKWEFKLQHRMEASLIAKMGTLTDEEIAEWTPLMHIPPQGTLDIEISGDRFQGNEAFPLMLSSLLQQWDGYAYDLDGYGWVSKLLTDYLPPERIIRPEPPPPRPPSAWIWVNGKYTKNELYEKNEADQ